MEGSGVGGGVWDGKYDKMGEWERVRVGGRVRGGEGGRGGGGGWGGWVFFF